MPQLAALSVMDYVAIGATALSATAQIQAGKAANHRADVIAHQKELDAKAAQAEAGQRAAGERKKSKYLRSRALAVAGASGAGVSDPTISNILTGIDVEGEMNALNEMWSGNTTAGGLRSSARMTRSEGRSAERAGYTSAFTTALSGGMDFAENNPTFFKKYGGTKADQAGNNIVQGEWDWMNQGDSMGKYLPRRLA